MVNLLHVFLLAMTPVGELRLSIPLGITLYNLNAILVFLVSVIGNLVPALLILMFFQKVSAHFYKKNYAIKEIFVWWENNTRQKHYAKIQKYGVLGLALFVAIPLPFTGAWTGSLLAVLMNLPLKKSLLAIFSGITVAGLIVTSAVIVGINIEKYFGWQVIIATGTLAFFTWLFCCKIKKTKKQ